MTVESIVFVLLY